MSWRRLDWLARHGGALTRQALAIRAPPQVGAGAGASALVRDVAEVAVQVGAQSKDEVLNAAGAPQRFELGCLCREQRPIVERV